MLEHLERKNAKQFLVESLRVLKPGGFLRIAVPDLKLIVNDYLINKDGDAFIEQLGICRDLPDNIFVRIFLILFGSRHHKWAYDGNSMKSLLQEIGYSQVFILSPGETKVSFHGNMNLEERKSESLYVEAVK
jgi:predicted SAM-dependent methyltransferase